MKRGKDNVSGRGLAIFLLAVLASQQFLPQEILAETATTKPQPFVLDGTTWDIELTSCTDKGEKKRRKTNLFSPAARLFPKGLKIKDARPRIIPRQPGLTA